MEFKDPDTGKVIFTVTKEGVTVGDKPMVKHSQSGDEFTAYARKVELETRVHQTLNGAIGAYMEGIVSYENAYENLKTLHIEFAKADFIYKKLLKDIDAFMESPIVASFEDNWINLELCVKSIIDHRENQKE